MKLTILFILAAVVLTPCDWAQNAYPATDRYIQQQSPQQQITEMERRLQPFYDDDPNSLRDDEVFQHFAEQVHHSLTEALNAGRPENERVTIPVPRIFVFEARQAKSGVIPARDHNGDSQYAMARSQNLDTLLDDNEKRAAIAHELAHLALRSDHSGRTLPALLALLSKIQADAVQKLLKSESDVDRARGKAWLDELLSDQGARIATCSDAINSANQKMDAYDERQLQLALGDLYPQYQKLSEEEKYRIECNHEGKQVCGLLEDHPPMGVTDY
jgi:hypothetical protein